MKKCSLKGLIILQRREPEVKIGYSCLLTLGIIYSFASEASEFGPFGRLPLGQVRTEFYTEKRN
jgi:hypothetical protein